MNTRTVLTHNLRVGDRVYEPSWEQIWTVTGVDRGVLTVVDRYGKKMTVRPSWDLKSQLIIED